VCWRGVCTSDYSVLDCQAVGGDLPVTRRRVASFAVSSPAWHGLAGRKTLRTGKLRDESRTPTDEATLSLSVGRVF